MAWERRGISRSRRPSEETFIWTTYLLPFASRTRSGPGSLAEVGRRTCQPALRKNLARMLSNPWPAWTPRFATGIQHLLPTAMGIHLAMLLITAMVTNPRTARQASPPFASIAGIEFRGIAAASLVARADDRQANGPTWVRRSWILRQRGERGLHVARGQIALCQSASSPRVGAQFRGPTALDPRGPQRVVQSMAELVGDDGNNSGVAKALVGGREELRGVHQFRL